MRIHFVLVIASALLTACSGGETTSEEETPGPDPFISDQWYLLNNGQSALTASGAGGQPGADINAFNPSVISTDNYAQGMTGTGIEVAVIDTGLEIGHEDLQRNVIEDGSYNFISASNGKGINDPTSTATTGDHGTSVSGLLAARGNNSLGIWGTAPRASLRGYNFLASSGDLNEELACFGLASAAAAFPQMTVRSVSVFNKSYGRNPTYVEDPASVQGIIDQQLIDAMETGTEQLRDGKGAIYVKAGGNEYTGGSVLSNSFCQQAIDHDITCYNVNQEPENAIPYQLVVGAFNADDRRSSFSNTGSALWVVGPGGEFGFVDPALVTTDQSGCDIGYSRDSGSVSPFTAFNTGSDGSGNESCNYYSAFNGTSSAAPVVAGAVALLMEAYPDAEWRDVKDILATTARQIHPTLSERTMTLNAASLVIDQGWVTNAAGYPFSNEYGFGAIDVQAAISKALLWKAGNIHLGALQKVVATEQTFGAGDTIPNETNAGLTKTQAIATSLTAESVALTVDISAVVGSADRSNNKIDASDYVIKLTSPSGTESIMLTPFNAFNSGYDLSPFTMISHAFYGENISGTWTLQIIDVDGDDSPNFIADVGEGKLDAFQLTFYGH